MRHWLAHLLGWNLGDVTTWWEGDSCFVGFKCAGCGKVQGTELLFRSRCGNAQNSHQGRDA